MQATSRNRHNRRTRPGHLLIGGFMTQAGIPAETLIETVLATLGWVLVLGKATDVATLTPAQQINVTGYGLVTIADRGIEIGQLQTTPEDVGVSASRRSGNVGTVQSSRANVEQTGGCSE